MAKLKLKDNLVNKSIEAFILGLEIYNKPTLRYRVEAFSFFVCNAWELMLKAEMLNRKQEIFYPNTDRTYDLSHIVSRIYTDKRQPLRINLEKIIDLRNTSTHFVTEDYETIYVPLFQSCVFNFSEQISRFHQVDLTKHIAQNFLTLSASLSMLTNEELRIKYTRETAERIIKTRDEISDLTKEIPSNGLSIQVQHNHYHVRNKKDADFTYSYADDSEQSARVLKQLVDPNDKFSLSFNHVIDAVNKQLKAKHIDFSYTNSKGQNVFNSHCLSLIINFYDLKSNENYCFQFATAIRYSQQTVEFIIERIVADPDLINKIKTGIKKTTPGS